jgi:molybdenum cofactor cytidylyltransferase
MVRHVSGVAAQAGLEPLCVVTSTALLARVTDALQGLDPFPSLVAGLRPENGLGDSLREGAAATRDDIDAVVVLLGDQPLVTIDLIHRIVGAWRRGRGRIVRPVSGDLCGHPVLFDSAFLHELRELRGEHGGREIIARHMSDLCTIEVDDPACLFDVDTPDDYLRLLRLAWRADRTGSHPADTL